MIVIVTGEREWADREHVWDELDVLFNRHLQPLAERNGEYRKPEEFVLRHGVGGKTDYAANDWGIKRGVTIERFPADWHGMGGGIDFSAGPRRNRAMAQKEPRADVCLAFWSGKFTKRGGREVSGTFTMITAALAAGIPVNIHPPRAT